MKITLTTSYLKECLKQARYYEFCKDSDRALTVLKPIWSNIEEPPNLDGLSRRDEWEILLLCGSVISTYGLTHQKKHYKELSADMLTRSRETAIAVGERDMIAESEKQLAIAYWRHGEFDNATAFLKTSLSHYSVAEQLTHPMCLYAQSNLLVLYVKTGQPEVACETIEKLKFFVDDSEDVWLKTGFYNQAAGVYVLLGNHAAAIPLLEKAVEYSTLSKNNPFLGSNLNNLANAYLHLPTPDYKRALTYIDQAIKLFLSINQIFPYALALETKALMLVNQGDVKNAMMLINESIGILEKGENYAELCDSLWTRIKILIKTSDTQEAFRQFNSLLQIANERLNLLAGEEYIEQFSKLVYLPVGRNLEEKEFNFRQFLLDEALAKCGGIVGTTANYLGVMHQTLSAMLKKFPALLEKHQVKLRTRTGGIPLSPKLKSHQSETGKFALRLQSNRLAYLGLTQGTVIEITHLRVEELDLSKPVVIQDIKKNYHCGFLIDAFDMFAFEDGRGEIERTLVLSEIINAGQVTGVYQPAKGKFVPLKTPKN